MLEVKVTEVPAHTGLTAVAIVMEAVGLGVTETMIVFEVAGVPVAQVALEVSTQTTWSLFIGT